VTNHPSTVAVVTPWYPSAEHPFRGAFVQAMVDATGPGTDMSVYHCEEWGHRLAGPPIEAAYAKLLPRTHQPLRFRPTVGGARVTHIPVPLTVSPSYALVARRHAEVLGQVLRGKPLEAEAVHAHVGLQGGWGALSNVTPDTPVYVTEHATFLSNVLAQPDAREMYDELLHRVAGYFAVGAAVSQPLIDAFPHHKDKIELLPNPISFEQPRAEPVTALRRWFYAGSLSERKGVTWLLEAFARCHAEDGSLTLTMIGDGPLHGELVEMAEKAGVTGAVTFAGPQPPERALELMREHDLLVHPSRFETFGMTIVEASAAGMPVLVTRSGGPQETLAGIESDAGELVAVEESSDSLVEGYRRLRDRFPEGLDLDRARRELDRKYGYAATKAAHHRLWFGDSRG
jgi:glycogen synthase